MLLQAGEGFGVGMDARMRGKVASIPPERGLPMFDFQGGPSCSRLAVEDQVLPMNAQKSMASHRESVKFVAVATDIDTAVYIA